MVKWNPPWMKTTQQPPVQPMPPVIPIQQTTQPVQPAPPDSKLMRKWHNNELPPDFLQAAGVPSYEDWKFQAYTPEPGWGVKNPNYIPQQLSAIGYETLPQIDVTPYQPYQPKALAPQRQRPLWERIKTEAVKPSGMTLGESAKLLFGGPFIPGQTPAELYSKYIGEPVGKKAWEATGIQQEPAITLPFSMPGATEKAKIGVKGVVQELGNLPLWLVPGGGGAKGVKVAENIGLKALQKLEPSTIAVARSFVEKELTRLGPEAADDIVRRVSYLTGGQDAARALVKQSVEKTGVLAEKVAANIPEVTPKVGEGGGLARVESMWAKSRQKPPKDIPDAYLKLQEQINDATFGLRRLQGQVEKGGDILRGGEKDVRTLLTRSPGVANAGATRYMLTINEIKQVAPDIVANDINTIIYANHAKEILAEKGAERVMAGGFKTAEELDTVLVQLQSKLGADKFNRAQQGAEVVKRVYGGELDRLVQSGLINKELGNVLKTKYPWYNPLQYVDDAEKLVAQGKSAKPYTVISSGLKRLTEKGTEKAARSPLDVMADQLVKNEVRIHKNEISRAIVQLALDEPKLGVTKISTIRPVAQVGEETVFRPYKGEIPGTLSYFDNGVRQVYRIPDWIYREADTLTKTISNPVASLIGSLNGISRAAFTTVSPPFVVSNMLNDSLTAFIKGGILPWETAQRLISSLKGLAKDKIMQSFRLSGAYQMRFYGKDLAKQVIKDGGMVLKPNESILTKIWKFIPEAGEAGEQAPRMAFFKKQLNKTLPNWKSMTPEQIATTPQARAAASGAVELTINFGRGGYLVKAANPFIIFLNASMEGAKLPFRTLIEIPAARWRLAGVGAGMMGLTAYNLSYPEYFDIPHNIRWGSVLIMLPSKGRDKYGQTMPNYLTIIPRTREWGLFLGSTVYAMEKMYGHSPTDFGKFSAVMAPQLSPIAEVPVPQVIAELTEQGANWDFYSSQPIVPVWLKKLPPEEQTSQWVSPTIEKIANTVKVSPLRLQHATQGLFGGAGQSILSVPDYIINMLSGEPQKGIPIISSIIQRVYPERGGQLYRTQKEQAAKQPPRVQQTIIPFKAPVRRKGVTSHAPEPSEPAQSSQTVIPFKAPIRRK